MTTKEKRGYYLIGIESCAYWIIREIVLVKPALAIEYG